MIARPAAKRLKIGGYAIRSVIVSALQSGTV